MCPSNGAHIGKKKQEEPQRGGALNIIKKSRLLCSQISLKIN